MRNIDKVREMTPKELVKFMKSDICSRCTYNGTNCHSDFCTEGMTQWLEQESELGVKDISNEFESYCKGQRSDCFCCYYNINGYLANDSCRAAYIVKNFNIIDGEITRR